MTVYIIQDQKHVDVDGQLKSKFNFAPAREYGELKYVLKPSATPFDLGPAIKQIHDVLCNYQDGDFLLLTGSPVFIGLTTALALDYNGGNVSLLQWSGARGAYIPIHAKDVFTAPEED